MIWSEVRQSRVAGLCASLILVAGCVSAGSLTPPPDGSAVPSGQTQSPTPTIQPSAAATDGCGTSNLWVDYAPYTTSTLASYGWGFVVADVKAIEPAIFNTEDGKKPRGFGAKRDPSNPDFNGKIFTPVAVQVDQVISGRAKPGANRFLIEGGTIGCYTTTVDVSPIVEKGSRYVFVLTDAKDAKGQKLLDLQEAKFAWPVDASGVVQTPDGPNTLDWLAQTVAKASASPPI
jgi:hypothetical protein